MKNSEKALPQHLNDFLDWLDVEKGLGSKTQENYSRFLRKFLKWLEIKKLSSLKPHELTPEHIWDYRVYLSRSAAGSTGLKKTTQNYYLIALRQLMSYFTEHDINSLPAEKIKLARAKEEKPVRFLTVEQVEKLFSIPDVKKLNGCRDRAILETFFSTGMRISELTALNAEQLKIAPEAEDFELSIVGKGSHTRTVYFSKRALHWIRGYLKMRGHKDTEKALFVNFRGARNSKRLTPRFIEKMIKKCALLAGLPANTTPHVMRHSFATDLLSQGVDLRVVQEFLGHRSITATQIYTHVTSKRLKDIHKKHHSLNA